MLLDGQATVRRVEILAYHEACGDGVRGEAFRKQFVDQELGELSGGAVGPTFAAGPWADARVDLGCEA